MLLVGALSSRGLQQQVCNDSLVVGFVGVQLQELGDSAIGRKRQQRSIQQDGLGFCCKRLFEQLDVFGVLVHAITSFGQIKKEPTTEKFSIVDSS